MPVISVDPEQLVEMTDTDQFELLETLPKLGIEIEKMTDESWDLEIFPDRCDNLSVEGLSRTVKGFLGKETGIPDYEVKTTDIKTHVELSVQEVRPYIVTAVVKNVQLTEELLKSLMDVQEKLHMTLGRKREKVAIGIHDLDKVQPPFTYKAVSPSDVSFIPLQRSHEMNLQEILEKHEKGKEYAHILEDYDRYPIILDSNDEVLSFPPVINGVLTEVTEDTQNIFIDMTGTDEEILIQTLNILCTLFADRGGELYSSKVIYGKQEKIYPSLDIDSVHISSQEVKDVLGVNLDDNNIIDILARMRYDTTINEDRLEVKIPPYRHDIHHPWDIIEDIAIGHGLDKFEGESPKDFVVGQPLKNNKIINAVVETLLGHGFQEVVNFTLSNPKREYDYMGLKENSDMAMIENPVTEEHTGLRIRLLPTLLYNLRSNRNKSLPQKLFEVGDVVESSEQYTRAGGVMIHSETGFTEIKSLIEGVAVNLGLDMDIESKEHDSFIEGRCASINVKGMEIGYFGEIHPKVLENFELVYPTTGFELDIDKLSELKSESERLV
ncbi:MAG: phenylalanine--tRNA ligase subunit beta [Candidatus Saliniplasma sp.]